MGSRLQPHHQRCRRLRSPLEEQANPADREVHHPGFLARCPRTLAGGGNTTGVSSRGATFEPFQPSTGHGLLDCGSARRICHRSLRAIPERAGGLFRRRQDATLTAVPTLVKVPLALEPSVVMAAMHTTTIKASMTAYSTAVGPSSRCTKLLAY